MLHIKKTKSTNVLKNSLKLTEEEMNFSFEGKTFFYETVLADNN